MKVGIEKINIYAGSLKLDIEKLAIKRERDVNYFKEELMIYEKSQNVDFEDVITLAVNAAKPIISESDKRDIELCIFATESGLDYCKPNSTYICKFLGLNSNVRNFEIKNACYAATSAIQMSISWIMSQVAPGKKALVISSDINYDHKGRVGEEVPGVCAVAMIISDTPRIIEYEIGKNGYFTFECTDYARPTPTWDIINSQESLYAYLDCLEGAFNHYKTKTGDFDFNSYFKRVIYHTPFGGLVKLGHGRLLKLAYPGIKKSEIAENFKEKVLPSFKIPFYVGNTYSSTVYTCLLGLINDDMELKTGDRIGIYSYGSGSTAEFYSAVIMEGARDIVRALDIDAKLKERYELSVDELDYLSELRNSHIGKTTYRSEYNYPAGWFDRFYSGRGFLTLERVENYIRYYKWS